MSTTTERPGTKQATGFDMRHKSRVILDGNDRAGARAMLKGIGFDDEDLKRPIIGVAHCWIETMPCNLNLRDLARHVKEGIRAAGGTPQELNTISISDGVTMGTEGMKASLVSREMIADSVELVARGHMFDAIIGIGACDKTLPGLSMALVRLNIPGFLLYSGSIMPGHFHDKEATIRSVYEAIGANAAGKMSDEELIALENVACPGAGACGGQYTANTMAMAMEFIGLSPMGSASPPAVDSRKKEIGKEAGELIMDVLSQGVRPKDILTREAFENAIAGVATSGGSTNSVLHLLALAREAGIPLTIDDFDDISRRTPLFCDLMPGGRYAAYDLDMAGGTPVVAKRMVDGGFVHADAMTLTGETFAGSRRSGDETPGQDVVRQIVEPDQGLRRSGHPEGQHRAGRRGGEALWLRAGAAPGSGAGLRLRAGGTRGRPRAQDQPGRRRRHPLRGPGRWTRHAGDARRHRRHRRAGTWRFGRAGDRWPLQWRDQGLMIGHVAPEAVSAGRWRRCRKAIRSSSTRPRDDSTSTLATGRLPSG